MNNVQCCFCGENVDSDNINPCELVVVSNWDKSPCKQGEQVFWTHMECLRDGMHESLRQYLVLDILAED